MLCILVELTEFALYSANVIKCISFTGNRGKNDEQLENNMSEMRQFIYKYNLIDYGIIRSLGRI